MQDKIPLTYFNEKLIYDKELYALVRALKVW
jgi:hypothetical protein